ncbi:hypothetical protein ABBQ38_010678 [Trebouxia sp. C0009 RCD-2024]
MTDEVDGHQTLKLVSEQTLLSPPNGTRKAVCGWNGMLAWASCMTLTVVIFGVTLGFMALGRRHSGSINCLYALGGGKVVDGIFPEPRVLSAACRAEFREYFQWQEYQLAGFEEDDAARQAWQEAGNAPPLMPSRSLYHLLYQQGFTVTFITGRHEGGSNRDSTASNLEAAGYGVPCKNPLGTDTSEPCYLQLDMRAVDDTRLASVYKPDRRAQLVARGYSMAGSIGDQWSDLAGTSPATASFKLPNPMYYIL